MTIGFLVLVLLSYTPQAPTLEIKAPESTRCAAFQKLPELLEFRLRFIPCAVPFGDNPQPFELRSLG